MASPLGKILLIVNPVAQNGNGLEAGALVTARLEEELPSHHIDIATTNQQSHAVEIAAQSGSYDTVIALGGDGIIHEVMNGLMAVPKEVRPTLGIVPVGSGNDFAKSLAVSKNPSRAVLQILDSTVHCIDVGKCNDRYFIETLSFGLDAAIAHDTMERRKRTGKTGTRLYLEAGIDQLCNHLDKHTLLVSYDEGPAEVAEMYLYAIQNGPSYGGGFEVCPDASLNDGMLDICYAVPPVSLPRAIAIFLMAKNGHHTRMKPLRFRRASLLHLRLDAPAPAQIDGEVLTGTQFDISVLPKALSVLVPTGVRTAVTS